MINEYYGVASTPTSDFLAHYGVKGMRWGVRKAIVMGNQKKLDQHFKKAAKKLSKLQDKALHSGKYAAKAAAYGAAAAGTGALAVGGTKMVGSSMSNIGKALENKAALRYLSGKTGNNTILMKKAGAAFKKIGGSVDTWGNQITDPKYLTYDKVIKNRRTNKLQKITVYKNNNVRLSNDTKLRIGTGLAALGLGAAAAKNAYIAKNGNKYLNKAGEFKNAMDEAFSGTKYQGQYVVPPKKKKKRR